MARYETCGDPKLELGYNESRRFAASINAVTPPYWLSLVGGPGTGKTHLAEVVWELFMKHRRFDISYDPVGNRITGNTGQFCDWRQFCKDIREGSFGRIDDLIDDWFVILEDIGTEHDPNGFIASALDQILNGRRDKWTMITCNLSLQHIAKKIDARVASRLLRNGGVVVDMDTTDYALRKPSRNSAS